MKFDPANPDLLTDRAKRVFVEAESVAMRRGSPQIATEDLLLALARCDRGVGRAVLERFSIEADQVREALPGLAPRHEVGASRPAALGFSPESLRVLAWAKEEAAALGHRYLGTEHLVLGLLRDETSKAGAYLRDRAASVERAREILHSILQGDDRAKTA